MPGGGLLERKRLSPNREVLGGLNHPASSTGAGDGGVLEPEGGVALWRLVGVDVDFEVGVVAHAHDIPGQFERLRVARLPDAHES